MERHSVAQIIGAPAGYIGYGDGGKLTERIRRKPYAVVLFDEIEKAHPDVFNILLQILDEGTLTDAEGRKVSFKNTLIILTSNIGTAAFTQTARIGFEKHLGKEALASQFERIKRSVLEELKKEMRPELLARLDHILVFSRSWKRKFLKLPSSKWKTLRKDSSCRESKSATPESALCVHCPKEHFGGSRCTAGSQEYSGFCRESDSGKNSRKLANKISTFERKKGSDYMPLDCKEYLKKSGSKK